ncbi:MAG: hypothetical protein KatS3mg108_3334 [Isosphaeraceae bacterium]|jgi:CBS domain containing-hemolysin-like protein|nr:MAG: hypothetical protein KatS3mg108_3334 [Isosphaeraceae bacterium]
MNGTLQVVVLLALVVLAVVHLAATAVGAALRVYSLSVLKEICANRGRPDRAHRISAQAERVERTIELTVVLTTVGIVACGLSLRPTVGLELPTGVLALLLGLAAIVHLAAGFLGRARAEWLLDQFWPLAEALHWPLEPLVGLIRLLESWLSQWRPAGRPPLVRPASVELEIPIRSGEEPEEHHDPELSASTRQRLERVIAFEQRTVVELMTPRLDVVALPASVSLNEAALTFVRTGLSRIPLYGENRDDLVGILYAKDLLPALADPSLCLSPRRLAREALLVPETKSASALLDELRSRRVQIALIVDEYGSLSGLITLEDLLEQIVGPIHDEHDPAPDEGIRELGGGRYDVDAGLTLEELNDRLGLHLPLPSEGDYHTLGGLAFDTLGRIPEEGASFQVGDVRFTVLRVENHAVRRLRVEIRPPVEAPLAG